MDEVLSKNDGGEYAERIPSGLGGMPAMSNQCQLNFPATPIVIKYVKGEQNTSLVKDIQLWLCLLRYHFNNADERTRTVCSQLPKYPFRRLRTFSKARSSSFSRDRQVHWGKISQKHNSWGKKATRPNLRLPQNPRNLKF